MALFRQNKRRVSLFCETALGVSVSPGLVIKLQNLVTESTRPAYDELVQSLPQRPAVNVDETPTRQQNRNAWIWTIVSKSCTVFAVRLTKAATVINDLLGPDYKGIVTSDRAKMYDHFARHQVCWAHLKRDFEALANSEIKTAAKLGLELCELTYEVFHHWHRVRDGTVQRPAFLQQMRRLQGRFYLAFEEGLACAETAGMCDNLLQKFDTLFEFTRSTHHAIEPTNNAAERALRHAVIWKHLSFGTQSEAGSRFVETLLSILETCRQQGRDLLDFLRQSLSQHLQGQPGPSLLPNGVNGYHPDGEYYDRLLQQIVGFHIVIDSIEGKWKLSQNQSTERQQEVVARLREHPTEDLQAIADLMEQNLFRSLSES